LEPTVSSCDGIVRICVPDEWLWSVGVIFPDEAVDSSLEVVDGVEDTVLETPPGQLGEEAFNNIEP